MTGEGAGAASGHDGGQDGGRDDQGEVEVLFGSSTPGEGRATGRRSGASGSARSRRPDARPRRRTERRRLRRRRLLVRAGAGMLAAAVLAVGLVLGVARLQSSGPGGGPGGAASPPVAPRAGGQRTLGLVTFESTDAGPRVHHIVVLADDAAPGSGSTPGVPAGGTVLLIPPGTLAEVPGHGLLSLGQAYAFGGAELLTASVENLLGVDLDHTGGVSTGEWERLVDRVGGLPLDLSGSGGDGSADAAAVAALLTRSAPGESELDALPRVQRVVDALLARIADDPAVLDELPGDPPIPDVGEPGFVRGLLRRLATLRAQDRTATRTLPVSPLEGGGRERSYRIDRSRVDELVAERLAGSQVGERSEAGERGVGRDLQILNGSGEPGIGQQVAGRLVPAGFRVVLTGNAATFDRQRTRILVYSEDPRQRRIAREVRDLLGVGVIQRSPVSQSVVDLTVVVGEDFPPGDEGAG